MAILCDEGAAKSSFLSISHHLCQQPDISEKAKYVLIRQYVGESLINTYFILIPLKPFYLKIKWLCYIKEQSRCSSV